MCFALRKTLRRGRSAVPLILRRIRSFRRSRPTICIAMASLSSGLRGLARLLADLLALIAHALASIRLRRPEAADLGGRLTHDLFVRTREDEQCSLRVARDLAFDPLGQREEDRVREAEREVDRRALELRAIAGPDELQSLRVALGDTEDHARQQRPSEPLEPRAIPALDRRRDEQRRRIGLQIHVRRQLARECPLRSLDLDRTTLHGRGDALRQRDGPLADAGLVDPLALVVRLLLRRHDLTKPRTIARRP